MYMWSLESLEVKARLRGVKKTEVWQDTSLWLTEEMIDIKRKTAFETQKTLNENNSQSYWISEQDVDQMRIKAFWEKQPLTEEQIDQMRENAFPSVLQRIKKSVNKIFNQEK